MNFLYSSVKYKEVLTVSVLIILVVIGYIVATKYPPAQQPTQDKFMLYVSDNELENQEILPPVQSQEIDKPKESSGEIFTVTAYDLSVQSCGKPIGHSQYGKTANGYSLANHTWDSAKTIAVDPEYIPLGSRVLIKFLDENFKKYNGIYTARDTGSAIKGRKIDFFMGDFKNNNASEITYAFGIRKAEIIILN